MVTVSTVANREKGLPEDPFEICADMATSALSIGTMCVMKRLEEKRSRVEAATLEKSEQVHNLGHAEAA